MYQNNLLLIDQLIRNQSKSYRMYVTYTVFIIVLGLLIIFVGQLTENYKTIGSAAGTFITSLSGFSFKEFVTKRESLNICETLKSNIEFNRDNDPEQSHIRSLIQGVLVKNI
jgi:cytochrome c biogenesis protein CcdA